MEIVAENQKTLFVMEGKDLYFIYKTMESVQRKGFTTLSERLRLKDLPKSEKYYSKHNIPVLTVMNKLREPIEESSLDLMVHVGIPTLELRKLFDDQATEELNSNISQKAKEVVAVFEEGE